MKRFYTLCVVLLVLSSLLLSAYAQDNGVGNEPPDPATWMPNVNLRNAVRAALRLNANEPLTQQKLLNLTKLNAVNLGITDLRGLEYATNLTHLYVGNNLIGDIHPLAHLTNLRRLGMRWNQVTDINVLAGLVNLEYVRFEGNQITNTSPLGNLPNLSDVDIEIPSLIPDANLRAAVRAALDIEPNLRITIDAMRNLTTLNAVQLGITDLRGLEYATNLIHLYLRDNLISDIKPLAHLTNLKSLSIGGNQVNDLTPLVNLTSLTTLYIGGNPIGDIKPLGHLMNLRRLGMRWNQITDIRILADLINLTYLRLEGNPITDTSPLGKLPNLSDVDIEIPSLIPDANLRAAVRAALGIKPNLRITRGAMRNLTTLNAVELGITDLTGLEYATNLIHLYLGNNLISDSHPLAHLTNLRLLSIGGNQISDLTPLANLTSLTELSIDGNGVSDISPLANLRSLKRLEARQNRISDISVLADLVNLEYLRLAVNLITDTSPLRSLPKLTDVDVYIFSPPEKENTQPQGEPTHFDTDPPQDDGQQEEDRRQDDSGQSQQQQQPNQNSGQQQQQSNLNSGQQQQQQPEPKPETQPQQQQSNLNSGQQQQQQQQQQPDQNSGQQQSNQNSGQQQQQQSNQNSEQQQSEDEDEDPQADCEAKGGTWYSAGVCVRRATPEEVCEAKGGTWDENSETCDGVEGLAPSYPKNAFILDRITLEQLDPATLEAQLDIWLAESDGSALYLRSIALLESVLAAMRPDKTHLLPNYPNPFNPETWIPYHLANPSEVQITIYDTHGTVVRHFDLGHQQEGYYTSRSRAVYWDGCNDIGEKVSSGIYFYQLQTDNTSLLRKMVILK